MATPKVHITKDDIKHAADAAKAVVAANAGPKANDTANIPASMHDMLAAYLIAVDKQEREPVGLGVLTPLSEIDKEKWEKFKRQNATVTFRLEDRSEKGFPRMVTGYKSGTVTFNFVDPVTASTVREALA